MYKVVWALLIAIIFPNVAAAQRNEIYNDRIATLKVVAGTNWMLPPVIKLRSISDADYIHISFDDLTHIYRRYTYKLEHCEADWSVSDELFASDYVEGFAEGNTIDNMEESLNTNVLYTHYSITIPNEHCRPKISGNYRLTVYDEEADNEPMFATCFMVLDPQMGVSLNVSSNTDIDINNSHQQVTMAVNYGGMTVNNPRVQIKTTVMQNQRWDNAKVNAVPQFIMADGLKWEHNKELIFRAGNEYHKYEILDTHHPTMGIDYIRWDGKNHNVYPFATGERTNYLYDEDANGAFYIRNSDNIENDRMSEYVLVHYRLKCPYKVNGSVYINGIWTNNSFTPKYEMTYNKETGCYEATIMQKQGYYSYQYLLVDDTGVSQIMPTEGSFYQTENSYQAYVYYKGQGERYDRLVGYQNVQYK
ncbi:MAG: DUF5103 domain-containing protein [Prevotella sp.]|uniref:type IX secretion system plug protein n=1 Tax=Prevotella sp. TaxID=59823 RepID=UPI002A2D4560|nr:DUF5103 domain-containing protein [Prevotella sp.]MDD7318675.1 DUF5103 domain-containing protein [Prevotellaceae bacterium]MDY4019369.1 DUF5103 domain-containing protein [Prevotella sp.]